MKGDPGQTAKCPVNGCDHQSKLGPILNPFARSQHGTRYPTSRRYRRQAISIHLVRRHPELGTRERSLLLDTLDIENKEQ